MTTTPDDNAIAILGGTGDQGLGLALRFAQAGRPVVIGSRKEEKALAAVEEVKAAVPGADVEGYENAEASTKTRAPVARRTRAAASRPRSRSHRTCLSWRD